VKLKGTILAAAAILGTFANGASADATNETGVARLDTVVVKGTALSRYRPETVSGGTFTDVPPERLPCVVDTLTEDCIRERNPTDLHDLMRFVPGIETGGKSLLIRQPGTFTIRGKGGTTPMLDGVLPIGGGAGLFMDPFLMERIEIVKGPVGSLNGGSGAVQNASGGGGSINLHMKSARRGREVSTLQAITSIGKRTLRQRGMFDTNETMLGGKGAVRIIVTADCYEPTYTNEGSQNGARPRESFAVAPSFVFEPSEDVRFGLKTMFQYVDQPSYIGVPVWRGRPGGGYSWYESSCRRGDRSKYDSFMLNPWVDWQVNDDWLLMFGASLMVNSWEQTTREPYFSYTTGKPPVYTTEFLNYCATGLWNPGNKYSPTTGFGKSHQLNRNYSLYARSVYDKDLWKNVVKNSFVVQPDYYYREANGGFGTPTSRYGLTLQDAVTWEWLTILGGVRYDHFEQESYTSGANRFRHVSADAVSPRNGISIQPLDWLVLFGNISQTRTPMLGIRCADGTTPSKVWRSMQHEAGVRLRTAERLWLSVSAYRIQQENTPQVDNSGLITGYDGRNVSRGAAMSLTGDITDDWTMMAMYAFNKYTDRSVSPGSAGRDFARAPAHTFSLGTSYRFSSGPLADVVVGCGYRFRSMSYATMRGSFVHKNLRFDPSHVFDINMSIPFSKFGGSDAWTLTLGVRNLFGEKYFESARHFYECLAGEPCMFEIGLRARF
jgi:iron complex outermembrane receptor protein